ncbi:hypothetical protein GCM10027091_15890 [Streptomyces daliensis]
MHAVPRQPALALAGKPPFLRARARASTGTSTSTSTGTSTVIDADVGRGAMPVRPVRRAQRGQLGTREGNDGEAAGGRGEGVGQYGSAHKGSFVRKFGIRKWPGRPERAVGREK